MKIVFSLSLAGYLRPLVFPRKFQPTLPKKSLVKVYKSFIRPPLDYGDVVTIELLTNVPPKS